MEILWKRVRLTKKPFWSAVVVKTASGGQGLVIKIKKHFINTFPLATNQSRSGAVTYTRRREGINTNRAVKTFPKQ